MIVALTIWFYFLTISFRFTKEDVHTRTNIKSSVQRGLKSKFVSQFDVLEPIIDDLIPKKSQVELLKCEDKIQLYISDDEVIFFQQFDELIPSLKIIHKYPSAFPSVKVDRGAIKFVLSGANIMCPGLTSPGADLPEAPGLPEGEIVAIYAEGKEHALAIGKLIMSTEDIKSKNKGIGIELFHYLGDGLWNFHAD
ncbi:Translation machinery-associated protein 20 [Wickerhamomyces ciferrii]|uniref:Translation machinery-associated protein 20 n=1 Tax=Wickerhamomyces ciferrii (strain ATCC 14091 / BCRC 22168 / CBS 111 / JCM 3599 / NBRC 0793 / NRRL Y-1031 F-60-10) TaxID=1206466 RepID=K0K9J0_WICCF|nr:Translation machinery-associated protein 20 [Wickerhamomyces ciferrii]CCH41580.1 Translation machinery-associated protein 20 [Wickerhamomyces ciferrii]